jgi:glyceraldehyde 3-phosphate dehydrogenase
MINIGINGFGRIGRLVFRAICDQGLLGKEINVVAVNDLVPADNLAYLVKYDSTQGRFHGEVHSAKSSPGLAEDDMIVVDGHPIQCLAVKEGPSALPWKALGVDIVIESAEFDLNFDWAAPGTVPPPLHNHGRRRGRL